MNKWVDFILYTWPELIYLIGCMGFCIPILRLVGYHVQLVGALKDMKDRRHIT